MFFLFLRKWDIKWIYFSFCLKFKTAKLHFFYFCCLNFLCNFIISFTSYYIASFALSSKKLEFSSLNFSYFFLSYVFFYVFFIYVFLQPLNLVIFAVFILYDSIYIKMKLFCNLNSCFFMLALNKTIFLLSSKLT